MTAAITFRFFLPPIIPCAHTYTYKTSLSLSISRDLEREEKGDTRFLSRVLEI